MTSLSKGKLLIVGMVLGFDKDHEIFAGVDWDDVAANELLEAQTVTKEDIFSMAANNKSFFEYKNAWKNLKKIARLIASRGDPITAEDMKKNLANGKNLVQMAVESGSVEDAFQPELWVGHGDDMEDAYYKIEKHRRGSFDFDKVRSALARIEGRETREDQLAHADITKLEMQTALRDGATMPVIKKLEKVGDHIRLADALLLDQDGDHTFCVPRSWHSFESFLATCRENGEMPDADFFLFKRGNRESIIQSAMNANAEKRIFNSKTFEGRPEVLIELFEAMPAHHQARISLGSLLAEITEKMAIAEFEIDDSLSAENLREAFLEVAGPNDNDFAIKALGLKQAWENIDDISAILGRREQQIDMDHLRQQSGIGGETCLFRAIRFGHFEKVLDIIEQNGAALAVEDLLEANDKRETPLDVLVDKGQLEMLLKPDLWIGRASALNTIWESLPLHAQRSEREAFTQAFAQVNRASLRRLGLEMTAS